MASFVPSGAVDEIKAPGVHIISIESMNAETEGLGVLIRFQDAGGEEKRVSIELPRPSTFSAYQHGYYTLGPITFYYDLKFEDGIPRLSFRFEHTDGGETWRRWVLAPFDGETNDDSDSWIVIEG